jgi:hypothetical protein
MRRARAILVGFGRARNDVDGASGAIDGPPRRAAALETPKPGDQAGCRHSSGWIRTTDLTIMSREHLLPSAAACRSSRSANDVPHMAAAFCCGLPLPERFHMIAPAFTRKRQSRSDDTARIWSIAPRSRPPRRPDRLARISMGRSPSSRTTNRGGYGHDHHPALRLDLAGGRAQRRSVSLSHAAAACNPPLRSSHPAR